DLAGVEGCRQECHDGGNQPAGEEQTVVHDAEPANGFVCCLIGLSKPMHSPNARSPCTFFEVDHHPPAFASIPSQRFRDRCFKRGARTASSPKQLRADAPEGEMSI